MSAVTLQEAERRLGEIINALKPGEEVIVAEDVLTTGGSVREVAALVQNSGARVAGFAAVAERGESNVQFPAPKYVLLRLPLVTYPPDNCPLCKQGLPDAADKHSASGEAPINVGS